MRKYLRSLFRRAVWERNMDAEIRHHLAARADDLVATGASQAEAERQARLEFGCTDSWKEEIRTASRLRWLDETRQDLRYGYRVLRKSPGFTSIALLSLALGIGANTVVFSVLNALLLHPLNIPAADRVWAINSNNAPPHSYPNYIDIRDRNTTFEQVYAVRVAPMALDNGGQSERVWGYLASGNYWDAMRIKPALGRFFGPAEDSRRGASPYAVLSYRSWQTRFASDPSIIGRAVRINSHPYTVLGVAPREFHGTEVFFWPEIWVPMAMQAQVEGYSWLDERNNHNAWVGGRLNPGVSAQQAEANLASVAAQLGREHRGNDGMRLTLSRPGLVGSLGREPTQAFAIGVSVLAGLVLLAACVNLAALLGARATDRHREIALRVSIGASGGRIVRQLLIESLMLSGAGGALGFGVAYVLLNALSGWRAHIDIPIQFDVAPDASVLLVSIGASILTGLIFGSAPARRARQCDPAAVIKGPTPSAASRRVSGRDLLLPLQVALCSLLIVASLVAVRGLSGSLRMPLGMRSAGVAVAAIDPALAGYDKARTVAFRRQVRDAVANLPGVESAAYSSSVPLALDQSTTAIWHENDTDMRPRTAVESIYYAVSPGYFQTIGTRLLSGREFTENDDESAPIVAIINANLALKMFGKTDVVGRRVRSGRVYQIVGVAEGGKYETLTENPKGAIYFPFQQSYTSNAVILARSPRPESEVAGDIRNAVARLDPHLPIYSVGPLAVVQRLVYLPVKAAVTMLGAFGLLAIVLAITGVYGLAAYTVSRRQREIGIRLAIGAAPRHVLKMIFRRTAMLVGIGAAAGLAAGIGASTLLASIVYQASSRDPVVIGASVLVVAAVAVGAAFGPARRALRLDPAQTLRSE